MLPLGHLQAFLLLSLMLMHFVYVKESAGVVMYSCSPARPPEKGAQEGGLFCGNLLIQKLQSNHVTSKTNAF